MDFIVTFFRDVLDGPVYIIVSIISGILICSCIGYLAEQNLLKKKAIEDYKNSHAEVSKDESLSWNLHEANNQSSVNNSSNTIPMPQNAKDIQAVVSGIPTTVSSSQQLTVNQGNDSQNIGQ